MAQQQMQMMQQQQDEQPRSRSNHLAACCCLLMAIRWRRRSTIQQQMQMGYLDRQDHRRVYMICCRCCTLRRQPRAILRSISRPTVPSSPTRHIEKAAPSSCRCWAFAATEPDDGDGTGDHQRLRRKIPKFSRMGRISAGRIAGRFLIDEPSSRGEAEGEQPKGDDPTTA